MLKIHRNNSLNYTTLILLSVSLFSIYHTCGAQNNVRILQGTVTSGDVSLPPNSFSLGTFLTVYYEFNNDNTITMAINCNIPNQYFGIGFGKEMTGSDIWVFELVNLEVTVKDCIALRKGPPTLDTANRGQDSLQKLGYEIAPTYTLVKVKRSLNTQDSSDAVIQPGLTDFIYATGSSPTMIRHTNSQRGATSATLVENVQPPAEEEISPSETSTEVVTSQENQVSTPSESEVEVSISEESEPIVPEVEISSEGLELPVAIEVTIEVVIPEEEMIVTEYSQPSGQGSTAPEGKDDSGTTQSSNNPGSPVVVEESNQIVTNPDQSALVTNFSSQFFSLYVMGYLVLLSVLQIIY